MKALIIEDSAEVVEAVSLCFQLRWPEAEVATAGEGAGGINLCRSDSFAIVILDINLPDMEGFEVLRQVRSFSNVPIIILTVRGKEEDQTRGLEMGADDYIVKPFRPRDLVARVNAVMRRSQLSEVVVEQPSISRGKLVLDPIAKKVHHAGRTIQLTSTESRLLYVLMKDADRTVSSTHILKEVWSEEHEDSELIRSYVRRLRDKLEDTPPHIILTDRGEGYRFASPQ